MPDILSISSSAIGVYQRVLGVVSNNIANVGNESYVRQEGVVNQTPPTYDGRSFLGTGALFQGVERQYNAFIESGLRNATSDVSAQKSLVNYAERVMDVLGSNSVGLSSSLDRFFSAARAVSADPASTVTRTGLLREADGLASRFRDLAKQLAQIESETRDGIEVELTKANALAAQLARLNTELSKQQTLMRQPPALLDQRDQLLRDLSAVVDIRAEESPNGMVSVSIGGAGSSGYLVDGQRSIALEARFDGGNAGRIDLLLDPYGSQGRVIGGVSGGSYGGISGFRQQVLEGAMVQLDILAQTVADEVNKIHTSGVDGEGRQGEDLFAIRPTFEYKRMLGGQPLNVQTEIVGEQPYTASPVQLSFDARAGKVFSVALLGPFAVGDRIEVSLNGRSRTMTVEGDTSVASISRQLQTFIDSDSNGSSSDEPGFGVQLRTALGPAGDITVTSPFLRDYQFGVRVSSDAGRAQLATAQGLWTAKDPVTGEQVSGARNIKVGGLSITIEGNAPDGEQLTVTPNARPAGAIVSLQDDPRRVAAAAAFRGVRDVDNLGLAKATVVDEMATVFSSYPANVAGQKGGISNNPVASEAIPWDASLQIPIGVIPAGQRDAVYYLDPQGSLADLQILTRDGRHIAGRSLAARAETFQSVKIDLAPQPAPSITPNYNAAQDYVEFAARGEAGESLSFVTQATPSVALNSLSIVAGKVYRGTGTGSTHIGNVDSVLNGTNGKPLRVNLVANFNNANFDDGVAGSGVINGWTTLNQRILLGGQSVVGGWPTPVDATLPLGNKNNVSPGESPSLTGGPFTSVLTNADTPSGTGLSLELKSTGLTIGAYTVAHGPAVISNESVKLKAGAQVSFDWRAHNGGDNFDVYGYLLNTANGETVTLLDASGNTTAWTTSTATVPTEGDYKFVFISGTHDFSGGQAAGSRLLIDNITAQASPPPLSQADIQALTNSVSYANSYTTSIQINGQTITSDPATSTVAAATSLQAKIQQKLTAGQLQGISVSRNGDDLTITSTNSSQDFNVGNLLSSSLSATLTGSTLSLNDPGQTEQGAQFVTSHPIFNPGSTYSDSKINTLGVAGYREVETFYGVLARPLEVRPNGVDHLPQGAEKLDARVVADFPPNPNGVNIPAGAFTLNGQPMTGLTGVGARAVADWITANAGSTGIKADVEYGAVVIKRPASNGDGEIRLGFGTGGNARALASLGFRTGAYVLGEVPEDLAVFASGSGPVRVAASWQDQAWSVGERRQVQRSTPFEVRFSTATHYTIVDLETGDVLAERDYVAPQTIEHAGLKIQLSQPPVAGDTFKIDGNQDGLGDNATALRLVDLEKAKVTGPDESLTLSESYLGTVDSLANITLQSQTSLQALEVVKQQAIETRESVSGVSLDEEAADLIRFQQAYQAVAKSMQVSSQMFDAVLRI